MVRLLSILILASTLIGCSGLSAEKPTEIGELTPEQRDGPADYRIAPGDELEIAFFHTPELNTSVIVRPDGKIGLPLAQGLEAAGRTPEELATTLRRIYQAELLDPDVAVNVRTFSAYQIHGLVQLIVDHLANQRVVRQFRHTVTILKRFWGHSNGFRSRIVLDNQLRVTLPVDERLNSWTKL